MRGAFFKETDANDSGASIMMRKNTRRCVVAVALSAVLGGGGAVAQDRSFDPVTDAMLENLDPSDWLNWRRTLDGWGYSPLDQINTDNVDQLQLVWTWTMVPGLSQATPIVHDGVMYLPNPLNVVQALDAVSGDLLWEYRKEFERSPDDSFRSRSTTTRSISTPTTLTLWRWTLEAARSSGTTRSRTTTWATAIRAGRSSSREKSSPA